MLVPIKNNNSWKYHCLLFGGNYFYYRLWCLINYNENTHDSSKKKNGNNGLLSQTNVSIKELAIPFDLISPL